MFCCLFRVIELRLCFGQFEAFDGKQEVMSLCRLRPGRRNDSISVTVVHYTVQFFSTVLLKQTIAALVFLHLIASC